MRMPRCLNPGLRSFTLIELIVAMVISTIVIGATIAIWLNVDKLFKRGMEDTFSETNLVLFVTVFEHDMGRSETASVTSSDVMFSFLYDPPISYDINENYVVRTCLETSDTFKLKIEGVSMVPHDKIPELVKSISFTIRQDGKLYPMFFSKSYSNSRLINYQIMKNESRY